MGERNLLILAFISIIAVALIGANSYFWFSPIVGVPASAVFFFVNSIFWGRIFLKDEDSSAVKVAVGILITVALIVVLGSFLIVGYVLDRLMTLGLLLTVSMLGYGSNKLWGPRRRKIDSNVVNKRLSKGINLQLMLCIVYISLIVYSFFILAVSRKDMTRSLWEALDPSFMPIYFVATLLLVSIISFDGLSANIKLPFIAIHAFLSLLIPFTYALLPVYDPWISLGWSSWSYNTGHIPFYPGIWQYNPLGLPIPVSAIYMAFRNIGHTVLSVVFARMMAFDVFLVHVTLIPAIWGLFAPFLAYGISFRITGERNIAVLSALLSYAYVGEILWGAWHTPNSLAFALMFFQLYCLAVYLTRDGKRYIVLGFLATMATALCHPSMIVLAPSFLLLAVVYKNVKKYIILGPAILLGILLFPLSTYLRGFIYPDYASFSLTPLSKMSFYEAVWKVVFGNFTTQSGFRLILLCGLVFFLGLLGAIQLMLRRGEKNPRVSTYFFILVLIIELDYRIFDSFMLNVPYSPSRILKISYFILLILMAVPIRTVYDYLKKYVNVPIKVLSKKSVRATNLILPLGKMLFVICIASIISANVIETYSLTNFKGLPPTNFELDVIKFIHEDAQDSPYIVLTGYRTSLIGISYVGIENPEASYFVQSSRVRGWINAILDAFKKNNPERAYNGLKSFLLSFPTTYAYFIVGASDAPIYQRYIGEPRKIFLAPSSLLWDMYVFRVSSAEEIIERATTMLNLDFEEWIDSTPPYWIVTSKGDVTLHNESSIVFSGKNAVYGKAVSTGQAQGILELSQFVYSIPPSLSFSFYFINHTHTAGRLHVSVTDANNPGNFVVLGFSSSDLGWREIGEGADFRRYRKSVIVQLGKWYTIEWDFAEDWTKVYPELPTSAVISLLWVTATYDEGTYTEAIFDALSVET